LSNGGILPLILSGVVAAPLFLFCVTLLPKVASRGYYLPHIDDFEEAAHRLSWRTLAIIVPALGGKALMYGMPLDKVALTLNLGLLKAFSWYFTAKTVCIGRRHPNLETHP
jgi:hypothetical protein